MREETEAARDAAYAYQPRNAGEEAHVLFIRATLDDAMQRVSLLDDYANEHARSEAIHAANTAASKAATDLAAAQQVTVSSGPTAQPGELLPETPLTPDKSA